MNKKSKGFNFDASVAVIEVIGLGVYANGRGFSKMKIFSPGLRQPVEIEVQDVIFAVSSKVGRSTSSPCYDVENKIMGFPDEDKMAWCFEEWQINLDLIQPEPSHPDFEITLTDGATA